MSERDARNPYAVTTLEIGTPVRDPIGTDSRITRWMVYLGLPLMVVGAGLAFMDIESIVYCGPVMLVWGVIMVFLTRSSPPFRWFAWVCCGFPVAVFLIIFLMSWSPQDAQHPISILIALFTAAVIYGAITTFALSRAANSIESLQPQGFEAENLSPAEPPVG